MPKVDFQERSTATVKVSGVDQATLPPATSGVGPHGFPVPIKPPAPLSIVSITGSLADGIVNVIFDRAVLGNFPPDTWGRTSSPFNPPSTLIWFNTPDHIRLVFGSNCQAGDSLIVTETEPSIFAADDLGQLPAGEYPIAGL